MSEVKRIDELKNLCWYDNKGGCEFNSNTNDDCIPCWAAHTIELQQHHIERLNRILLALVRETWPDEIPEALSDEIDDLRGFGLRIYWKDDLDNLTDEWHTSDTSESIYEFFGWTEEEYAAWVSPGGAPPMYNRLMGKKVKELKANPLERNGNKANCNICTPRDDRISHDRVWRWSRETGKWPLKDGVKP